MNPHVIMVVGVGSARFLQLLFSLYLAWYFGHAALASFVLMLSLSAAFGAFPSLGGGPQILRAGAYSQPEQHIQMTLATSILLLVLSLFLLPFATMLWGGDTQSLRSNGLLTAAAVFFTTGSVCFAMIQSLWSYQQKYKALGLFALLSYILAFIIAWMASVFLGKTAASEIITIYALVFMLLNALVFYHVGFRPYTLGTGLSKLLDKTVLKQCLEQSIKAALFGFITLFGLYALMKAVNVDYSAYDAAVFSLSFQFFQIGIFIPSVLGAVFVPKLVKQQQAAGQQKTIYLWISMFWVFCSAIALVPVFYLYHFALEASTILTFVLLQCAVPLSALQAMYIQQHVAMGKFSRLALNALCWATIALSLQAILPTQIYFSALAILLAYAGSVLLFFCRQPQRV